ncbi:KGG domain-containing protein [uncultured Hymenobacter sp.]|uniref:KGG domain-containing protein n=1 Tax=uncultured Hymenobacter sp. TaxID=170016 RepID=UPI0035CA6370
MSIPLIATPAAESVRPAEATVKVATRPANRVGTKSRRGFAAMDPETQRRIASEGGRASHESGRGHRFSTAEARAAGRKGGLVSRKGKKA